MLLLPYGEPVPGGCKELNARTVHRLTAMLVIEESIKSAIFWSDGDRGNPESSPVVTGHRIDGWEGSQNTSHMI
jgi:hypothetical protein